MAQSSTLSSFMPFFQSSIRQISSNSLQAALLVDVSCALLAHAWFRKFEPDDIRGGFIRFAFFAIAPIATAVIHLPSTQPWLNGLMHLGLFASVLLCSVLLYRVSPFHPMAKYPGPLICKLSKLWMAWLFHKGKTHVYLKKLHDKYGSIVRIGPNEISIVEVDLLPNILGQQGMPKGPMWEGRQPNYIKNRKTGGSIISLRDADLHAKYRKPWTRAFGPGPLQDYEESLRARANEMIEYLKENCRNSQGEIGNVDIAQYITYFSFDLMGDVAFGEGFSLMRDGDGNGSLDGVQRAINSVAVLMAIPWATGFARFAQLFASQSSNGQFSTLALQLAQRRIRKVTEKRDLFYHLSANMDEPNEKLVISNASMAVLAGSDTTASVLCGILYYLLRYPDYMQRLREELDQAFSSSADVQIDKLVNLEWLNAIINETLRLQPAVLTYMQRAPAEHSGGRRLGDMFIPERAAVVVPPYVLHRDPRYFSPNPNQFWPERWLASTSTSMDPQNKNEKIILNRSAFIPFSKGPASCAGKPLAWSQLRYITALLIYNFDFLFGQQYNPAQWEEDLLDKLMVVKGSLPVQMRVRVRS